MTEAKRRIWSYESACAELGAEPLRAESQSSAQPVWFREEDDLQTLAAKSKRGARAGLADARRIKAYPLNGLPERPNAVAEFAGVLLLQRVGHRLVTAEDRPRLPYKDRANLQWVLWGELVAAPGGQVALAQVSVAAWPGADAQLEPGRIPFNGISSAVLRALRLEQIIRDVVHALEPLQEWHRHLADKYGRPLPEEQQRILKAALARTRTPPRRQGRKYPDSHYHDVAVLYLALVDHGEQRRVLVALAEHLGVARETARDWVHRAREIGYLTPSEHGRPGAHPGPRLKPDL